MYYPFNDEGYARGFESDSGLSFRYEPNPGYNGFWSWWERQADQEVGCIETASCSVVADGRCDPPYRVKLVLKPALDPWKANYIRNWYEKESNIGFKKPDDGSIEIIVAEDIDDVYEAFEIAEAAINGENVDWDFGMPIEDVQY